MFLESLLETSAPAKRRRGWATMMSFLLETAGIGLLILVPMLYTDALPHLAYTGGVEISVPRGEPERPPTTPNGATHTVREPVLENDGVIRVPPSFPDHPYIPTEPEPPAISSSNTGPCVADCVPDSTGPSGSVNPIIGKMLHNLPVAKPHVENVPVPVSSGVIQGLLIHRVEPRYPPIAMQARAQGPVVLRAIIGRDGTIQQLRVESGHPLLVKAAAEAVQQWRYRPYYLNGQPVEVETLVTVNFVLNK